MKLGIVADEIDRDFAAAVRIGKSLGLMRYEVRNLPSGRFPICDPQELDALEATIEREGIEITAISPGLFKLTRNRADFEKEMDLIYPRSVSWAKRWKLPGLIVFGFDKSVGLEQASEWFSEAAGRAQTDGIVLMIEPEPICAVDTGAAAASVIKRVDSPALRINYDPGNVAWTTGLDPIGEFDAVAPHIANVHIKDMRPGPEWLPAGEGIIDFKAHFDALARIGYKGPISLEPHMDGREVTIRRCRDAVLRLAQNL
jgi:sugar phosphate isomerase/epimerase